MEQYSTDRIWAGLDVHQSSITAAVLYGDSHEPEVVRMRGDLNAVRKFFRRLSQDGTPRSCYEASGAGYVLQRALGRDGFHCEVIAPSLIPRKPGERRKTDKLDAIRLARLYRSGHLTPIAVPDQEQEAVRQLVRARLVVQQEITRLRHGIVRVLATHGYHDRGHPEVPISDAAHGVHGAHPFGALERRRRAQRIHHRYRERVPEESSRESTWHYRRRAGANLILNRRRQGQSAEVVAIAVKAQHRLSRKFWKLVTRSTPTRRSWRRPGSSPGSSGLPSSRSLRTPSQHTAGGRGKAGGSSLEICGRETPEPAAADRGSPTTDA